MKRILPALALVLVAGLTFLPTPVLARGFHGGFHGGVRFGHVSRFNGHGRHFGHHRLYPYRPFFRPGFAHPYFRPPVHAVKPLHSPVWVSGFWHWNGFGWVWVPGYWSR